MQQHFISTVQWSLLICFSFFLFSFCARLHSSKVFYLGPINISGPACGHEIFLFDIYVDGKVRWRAFLLALGLSFHARVMDRAVPGDSSIKEQHDNNNVTLHSSHGIMHVINDGVASRLCAFFCAHRRLGVNIRFLDQFFLELCYHESLDLLTSIPLAD